MSGERLQGCKSDWHAYKIAIGQGGNCRKVRKIFVALVPTSGSVIAAISFMLKDEGAPTRIRLALSLAQFQFQRA